MANKKLEKNFLHSSNGAREVRQMDKVCVINLFLMSIAKLGLQMLLLLCN